MAVFKTLCILVVYQFQGDIVTGDLFVSTIFWDRQERRGAGYRSIPEVLQYLPPVEPSAHAFDLEFLILQVKTPSKLEVRSLRLFLKIILIYTYRGCQGYSKRTASIIPQKDGVLWIHLFGCRARRVGARALLLVRYKKPHQPLRLWQPVFILQEFHLHHR
jgi:hypothetical protein